MPIRAHLSDHHAFDPDHIIAMSTALEQACAELQLAGSDQRAREAIAARIIDLARNGVLDPIALRDRVLKESRLSPE
jgi:hypothetical protein